MKNFLSKILNFYQADQHCNLVICGLRIRWKHPQIDRLSELCCIPNIKYLEEQNTQIVHPFGVLIHEGTKVGKNCVIYQHVTIGSGSHNAERKRNYPYLGDNVQVGANAVLVGGINIGNNVTIGAGSIVIRDVPDNVTVAGNPARIIKNSSKPIVNKIEQ